MICAEAAHGSVRNTSGATISEEVARSGRVWRQYCHWPEYFLREMGWARERFLKEVLRLGPPVERLA